jgi:CubicO group peptidase (beta-lactamase class C family)
LVYQNFQRDIAFSSVLQAQFQSILEEKRAETGAEAHFSWSSGGIISTAKDMAIWIHALIAGDLLEGDRRIKMQTLTWQSRKWAEKTFSDGSTEGMGLGLFKYNVSGVGEAWSHSGRISGIGNIAAYFIEDGFAVSNEFCAKPLMGHRVYLFHLQEV